MLIKAKKLQLIVTGFTCDRCGKTLTNEQPEHQEILHIDFMGGYDSVFGDGVKVECDLCQECLKVLIGDFCRTS